MTDQVAQLLREIGKHKPWLEAPDVWKTESAYWTWIRGELRRVWTDYPVRNIYKTSLTTMIPDLDDDGVHKVYKSGKKKGELRYRSNIDCSMCGKGLVKSAIEMDHTEPAGGCKNGLEACIFLFRLLCPVEHMRPVCKPCHKIHTYAERMGITFDEAVIEKRVIEFGKRPTSIQKQILIDAPIIVLENDISNAKKRKDIYRRVLNEVN